MTYQQNTPEDRQAMLQTIGAESIEELFAQVPAPLRLNRPLNLPEPQGEMELAAHMAQLAGRNQAMDRWVCFLGAGSYDHFVPAVVDYIAGRGEFYTSYTPYQPEVSQGNLQTFFEYQTMITQLTGMDVSNASLYDGGSAAAEAVLMSFTATGRSQRVVVSQGVHPEYRRILHTYLENLETEIVELACPDGTTNPEEAAQVLREPSACLLVQQPNFFGSLEEMEQLAQVAHEHGSLLVVVVDPISLGLLKRPGQYGADIVVAEGQSLGSPMSFGGPYLGVMACREEFLRRLPGRIAGQTVDRRGRRCWVLTLQTREQHIRREKATSNICTNQGLLAIRAAVYLSLLGPQGLREQAELCLQKAHYAARRITEHDRFRVRFDRPFFKEFVVQDRQGRVAQVLDYAWQQGIAAGVPLGRWFPELEDCFLVAVTEKRTREQIDRLAQVLHQAP